MPEVATGDSKVLVVIKCFAGGLASAGIPLLLVGDYLLGGLACALALALLLAGICWPRIRKSLGLRLSLGVDRVADIFYRYRVSLLVLVIAFVLSSILFYLQFLHNQIDMYVAPRIVTSEQHKSIKEYLSHYDPYAVTVKVNPRDEEAQEYSKELYSALHDTKWKAELSTADAEPNTNFSGLCIAQRGEDIQSADPEHAEGSLPERLPGTILTNALQSADIQVTCASGRGEQLFLLIGHRPRIIGQKLSLPYRLAQWLQSFAK